MIKILNNIGEFFFGFGAISIMGAVVFFIMGLFGFPQKSMWFTIAGMALITGVILSMVGMFFWHLEDTIEKKKADKLEAERIVERNERIAERELRNKAEREKNERKKVFLNGIENRFLFSRHSFNPTKKQKEEEEWFREFEAKKHAAEALITRKRERELAESAKLKKQQEEAKKMRPDELKIKYYNSIIEGVEKDYMSLTNIGSVEAFEIIKVISKELEGIKLKMSNLTKHETSSVVYKHPLENKGLISVYKFMSKCAEEEEFSIVYNYLTTVLQKDLENLKMRIRLYGNERSWRTYMK